MYLPNFIPLTIDIGLDEEAAGALSDNITDSIEKITHMSFAQLAERAWESFKNILPRLAWSAALFIAGWILIRLLVRFARKMLKTSKVDETLHNFILSSLKIVLYTILIITCVGVFGVNLTPLITALGAIGLAVSLAVKDSLSNLAGGISVLFSRPFAKGDYVEISGKEGTISEIGMVYTILQTSDNKKIFLPNGDVSQATIINYSAEPIRRLDITFTIKESSNFQQARAMMFEVVEENPLVLNKPEPNVRLTDQTFAHIKMTVMAWCSNSDLVELRSQLISEIRSRIREADL